MHPPVFDIHGSVHHNTMLIKMTNRMQLYRIIYYLLSVALVGEYSATTAIHVNETRSCNYS